MQKEALRFEIDTAFEQLAAGKGLSTSVDLNGFCWTRGALGIKVPKDTPYDWKAAVEEPENAGELPILPLKSFKNILFWNWFFIKRRYES